MASIASFFAACSLFSNAVDRAPKKSAIELVTSENTPVPMTNSTLSIPMYFRIRWTVDAGCGRDEDFLANFDQALNTLLFGLGLGASCRYLLQFRQSAFDVIR